MPAIDACIDWLSFSIKYLPDATDVASGILSMVLIEWPQLEIERIATEQSRKPYTHSYKLGVGGRVFFNPTNQNVNHYLIEIEGRGCRQLHDTGDLFVMADSILRRSWNITRFDLAVDIETETLPAVFAAERSPRWTTTKEIKSLTGQTYYVGSDAGDRYARVYRYYPPHERSHLLRVEMIHKKRSAREAFEHYLHNAPGDTAAVAGNSYKWQHPDWTPHAPGKIKSWRPNEGKAGTLRWLRTQVMPAIRALELSPDHPIFDELRLAIHEAQHR